MVARLGPGHDALVLPGLVPHPFAGLDPRKRPPLYEDAAMKLLVLLNDRARDGGAAEVRAQIERTFFRHDVRFAAPPSLEALWHLLRAETAASVDVVVACGGDGTVNVALQALQGTSIPLGILPLGTANDLADELGLTRDLEHASEVIKLKRSRDIDLIDVRVMGEPAGRVFATSGGTGLAADVAVDTNAFKSLTAGIPGVREVVKSLGKELYQLFLIKEFVFPAEHIRRLRLEFDDEVMDVETALIMVNNQAVVGGSFQIAPQTKNDDGTFCVSIFTDRDGAALARTTALVRQGRPAASVRQRETSSLVMRALDGQPLRFFGDGELLQDSGAGLALSVRSRAARVIVG
jgi:diacylglycerol kinase family enzyme